MDGVVISEKVEKWVEKCLVLLFFFVLLFFIIFFPMWKMLECLKANGKDPDKRRY